MTLPDKDSLATYGGPMSNYGAAGVVDPTTDEDAGWRNKYAANVAAMTHTIARAACSFLGTTGGATAIADPSTGFVHDAVWGDGSTVKPSATRISTGIADVIWPSTVTDELDDSHAVSLRRAWADVEPSNTLFKSANAVVTSANTVRVYTYASPATGLAPSLADLVGETITVFAT
jgi:hypothetical protein